MPPQPRLARTDFEEADAPDDLPAEVEVALTTYVYPKVDGVRFPQAIDVRGHGLDVDVLDCERGARTYEGQVSGQQHHFTLRLTGATPTEGVVEFRGVGERLAAFDVSI